MSNFLSISKSAANHIRKIMENGAGKALRIGLKKGGCAGMEYTMEYVNEISDAQNNSLRSPRIATRLSNEKILSLQKTKCNPNGMGSHLSN